MFIASDEHILCWGRALLMLEVNTFRAGDEHFSTGDDCIENVHSSFSHTHTASYQRFTSRIYVKMIIYNSHSYMYMYLLQKWTLLCCGDSKGI